MDGGSTVDKNMMLFEAEDTSFSRNPYLKPIEQSVLINRSMSEDHDMNEDTANTARQEDTNRKEQKHKRNKSHIPKGTLKDVKLPRLARKSSVPHEEFRKSFKGPKLSLKLFGKINKELEAQQILKVEKVKKLNQVFDSLHHRTTK